MEPADQIPRSRNRPPQNQNQPPTLNDNSFVISDYIQGCDGDFLKQKIIKITNDVDLIGNGGLEMIGQQFVRMRDIRWGKARHPRYRGWASPIYRDMNLATFVRSRDRLRFFAAVTKSWRRRLNEATKRFAREYLGIRGFVSVSAKHWALFCWLYALVERQWRRLPMITSGFGGFVGNGARSFKHTLPEPRNAKEKTPKNVDWKPTRLESTCDGEHCSLVQLLRSFLEILRIP